MTYSKIISVTALVNSDGKLYPPSYLRFSGTQYDFDVDDTTIYIGNSASNSSFILSKPFTVVITYEQGEELFVLLIEPTFKLLRILAAHHDFTLGRWVEFYFDAAFGDVENSFDA